MDQVSSYANFPSAAKPIRSAKSHQINDFRMQNQSYIKMDVKKQGLMNVSKFKRRASGDRLKTLDSEHDQSNLWDQNRHTTLPSRSLLLNHSYQHNPYTQEDTFTTTQKSQHESPVGSATRINNMNQTLNSINNLKQQLHVF